MAELAHIMIRVLDEDRSVLFYEQAFGLAVTERLDFESFTLVYLSDSENTVELELTINNDRTEPYDLGTGYGHIAFVVDDLEAEHQRFQAAGIKSRKPVDLKHAGQSLARFFFVQDPDGYEIEVIERRGRYQNSSRPEKPSVC